MGAPIRNFMVRGGADFSALYKEMKKAKKHLQNFSKDIKGSLSGIGQALAAIGASVFLGDAVKEAIKVEGAIDSINRLLGESAVDFYSWAKESANAFGMSKAEALDFGRTYAIMTSTFAKDSKESFDLTTTLLEQSAVVASKRGESMQEVMDRIASGLRGETESIQNLGIFTEVAMLESTNAFKRFAGNKSWNQLSVQTQAQIRYFAILEQATKLYGNELSNSTGAKLNAFTASLKDLQLAIGQAFTPILNVVLPILTKFVQKITESISFIAEFSRALFGGKDQGKKQAKSIDGMATSYTNAGDAAKQAKKDQEGFLAGFDEINNVPDNKTTAGDSANNADAGAGTGFQPNSEIGGGFQDISQKAKDMAETVKTALTNAKDAVIIAAPYIAIALAGIGAAFIYIRREALVTSIAMNAMTAISGGMRILQGAVAGLTAAFTFLTTPVGLIILAIGALAAACVYFYQTNEQFRGVVDGVFQKIGDTLKWVYDTVLVPVGTFLKDTFVVAWEAVSKAADWLYLNVLTPLGNFLLELAKTIIQPLADVLKDVLSIAFQTVFDIAKSLWNEVLVPLGEFLKTSFKPIVEELSTAFKFLWEKVLSPFSTWLGGVLLVVFGKFGQAIKSLWQTWIKPFATYLSGSFKTTFKEVFSTMGDLISDFKTIISGVVTFLTGAFTGDWKKAWQGLKDIASGVFDSFVDALKLPINLIINQLNDLIDTINKFSFKIPDVLGGGTFGGFNIPKIPKLARGGIVDSPTLAQVGEAGKEMIVPLENTSFVDKLAGALGTAVMSAMQIGSGAINANNSNNREVVLKIDGNTIARALNPYLTKETGRVGNTLIQIT